MFHFRMRSVRAMAPGPVFGAIACLLVGGLPSSTRVARAEFVTEQIVNKTGMVVNDLNVKFKNGAIVSKGKQGVATATKSSGGGAIKGNINPQGTAVDFPAGVLGNVGDGIGTPGDNIVSIRFNRARAPFMMIAPGVKPPPDRAYIDQAATQWSINGVPQGGGQGVRQLEMTASVTVDPATGHAYGQFFNYDSVDVTVSNISLYKDNSVALFNIDSFDTPGSSPVAGVPSTLSVAAMSTSDVLDFGIVSPGFYALLLGTAETSSLPGESFSLAAAEVIPEPGGLLMLGLGLASIGLSARAMSSDTKTRTEGA